MKLFSARANFLAAFKDSRELKPAISQFEEAIVKAPNTIEMQAENLAKIIMAFSVTSSLAIAYFSCYLEALTSAQSNIPQRALDIFETYGLIHPIYRSKKATSSTNLSTRMSSNGSSLPSRARSIGRDHYSASEIPIFNVSFSESVRSMQSGEFTAWIKGLKELQEEYSKKRTESKKTMHAYKAQFIGFLIRAIEKVKSNEIMGDFKSLSNFIEHVKLRWINELDIEKESVDLKQSNTYLSFSLYPSRASALRDGTFPSKLDAFAKTSISSTIISLIELI